VEEQGHVAEREGFLAGLDLLQALLVAAHPLLGLWECTRSRNLGDPGAYIAEEGGRTRRESDSGSLKIFAEWFSIVRPSYRTYTWWRGG
jgi:hypothetical protein